MLTNKELERTSKEADMANYKILSHHLLGGWGIHNQGNQCPGKDLNPQPPDYEAGMVTTAR